MPQFNFKLSKGQAEFMRRSDDELVIMSTSISYGKSFVAALWIITELMKGHKTLAAAQTHGALRKVLYDHVFNICSTYHIPYTKNKEDRSIKIGTGTCYGFSGESPDECLGMTNAHGFIMDEAARCPEVLYKNLSERCRGDGVDVPHHRLISSPLAGEPTAEWFVNLKKENPDCVIHGSLYEALAAKFVSERFVRSMEKIYPIGSELYKQQILGEDIESDFLNAIVKESDFSDGKFFYPNSRPTYLGIDLSGLGRDKTVCYVVNKTGIIDRCAEQKSDTNTQEAMTMDFYTKYGCESGCLDMTGGYGSGLNDALKHRPSVNMKPVTFSETPTKDIYYNIRSEMYMELAQAIKDGFYIDREKYPLLVEELRHTKAYIGDNGKLRIIPKEMIKKEIGRSSDDADALALAVYAMNHNEGFSVSRALNTLNKLKSMGVV